MQFTVGTPVTLFSITKRHRVTKAELFSWNYCLMRKIVQRVNKVCLNLIDRPRSDTPLCLQGNDIIELEHRLDPEPESMGPLHVINHTEYSRSHMENKSCGCNDFTCGDFTRV